jgi:hypothetical protein
MKEMMTMMEQTEATIQVGVNSSGLAFPPPPAMVPQDWSRSHRYSVGCSSTASKRAGVHLNEVASSCS